MVVQRGNAPRSFAYQANALLLSYGTVLIWRKASVSRRPPHERILFSRQVQPAYICLPSKIGCQGWTRTNTVRFNKPSCYFDTTWQLAPPAGFPPASFRLEVGCLIYSTTAALQNWSAWQDLHLRSPGPKPGALAAALHADDSGRF